MAKGWSRVRRQPENEIDLIARIGRRVRLPRGSAVALGIGDDCAIFRPRGGAEDLVFTTDMLIEGTHFRVGQVSRPVQTGSRRFHRPEDIGWKALARGLSDIAAMGGEPRFCLLSLALPSWADPRWVDRFYRGLLRLAGRERTPLAGGDLGHAEKAMCDIVVCGAVPRGRALRRDGARAGDAIYVSGTLGGSALGLETGRGRAWRRHLRPEPRLALGRFLRARLGATAAMDISDGLSLDLRRLCLASKLAAAIEPPPVWPGATLEQALHGGEDYELLFTAPPRTRVPVEFEGLALTRIGAMRRGVPGDVTLEGAPLPALGYDHLWHRHSCLRGF